MRIGFNYNHSNLSFEVRTLAVTGNISSGKSTVQKLFECNGIKCIDIDNVVHSLYKEDSDVINAVKVIKALKNKIGIK